MTTTVTKLDRAVVKQIVGKLPIELVNPLLKACNPDCNFLAPDDNSTDKKKLKIHREKLVNAIVESNDVDIFNRADELAKSLEVHDEKISPKQEKLKKINAEAKKLREEIKELDYIKQKDIEKNAQELIEDLGEEQAQELSQYYSDTEKARAELYRENEREKALKAYMKGLAISVLDDLEDKYVEAAQELNSSSVESAEKIYSEIEKDPKIKIDPNTVQGMKLIDVSLNKSAKRLVTKAINKSKLGLDYKNSPVMSALNTKAVTSKPQTVSIGV